MTSLQYMQALKLANKVKAQRYELKREILRLPTYEGRARLAELLVDPPLCLLTARVYVVLQWPARTGEKVARKWMQASRVGFDLTVGITSPALRADLARCLRGLHGIVEEEALDREAFARFTNGGAAA